MDAERHRSPAGTGLEHCTSCHRPFVVPVALLDLVDEGLYLLALECKNCNRLSIGTHEDSELEELEAHDALTIQQIKSAIELVDIARFIDGMSDFHNALDADVVLPEDF
jgi:hypothetical protein